MSPPGTLVACMFAVASSPATVYGANWQLEPRVEVGGTYDDNFLLSEVPGTEERVGGPLIDAELGIHALSPSSDLYILPRVHATYYPGHTDKQSTDGYLDVLDTLRTPRTTTNLRGSFADETILASDLVPATFPGVELGQSVVAGSGYVNVLERRELITLIPSTQFQWTQRRRLIVDLNYDRAHFSKSVYGQVDYQSAGGAAALAYDSSERSTLSVRLLGSSFLPSQGPNNTHYGLQGQWDFRETARVQLYVRAGIGYSQLAATPSQSATGFEGGLGAHWMFQITDLTVDALRSALPSSVGAMVYQDELRFRLNRRLTPVLNAYVGVRGLHTTEVVTGSTTVPNRSYATASAGFEWRFTRTFALLGAYTYNWQKFQFDPLSASGNQVGMSVVYEPKRTDVPSYFGASTRPY